MLLFFDSILFWQITGVCSFALSVILIPFCIYNKAIPSFFGVVFLFLFMLSNIRIDAIKSSMLESMGCVYLGQGEKGAPHVNPKEYYKCLDGVIRSK